MSRGRSGWVLQWSRHRHPKNEDPRGAWCSTGVFFIDDARLPVVYLSVMANMTTSSRIGTVSTPARVMT